MLCLGITKVIVNEVILKIVLKFNKIGFYNHSYSITMVIPIAKQDAGFFILNGNRYVGF